MTRLVILLPLLLALGCAAPAPQLHYANGVISIAGLDAGPGDWSPAPVPRIQVGALMCGRYMAYADPS